MGWSGGSLGYKPRKRGKNLLVIKKLPCFSLQNQKCWTHNGRMRAWGSPVPQTPSHTQRAVQLPGTLRHTPRMREADCVQSPWDNWSPRGSSADPVKPWNSPGWLLLYPALNCTTAANLSGIFKVSELFICIIDTSCFSVWIHFSYICLFCFILTYLL